MVKHNVLVNRLWQPQKRYWLCPHHIVFYHWFQCRKTSLPDDNEIGDDKTNIFKTWLRQPDNSDILPQIKISGDKDLQQKIRKVCFRYRCDDKGITLTAYASPEVD